VERRRAELYTCEIRVNGLVVCQISSPTPTDVLSHHEGRLNRSSPYPPSRIRFEIDWTGSNSHGTPGCVSVRFQFRVRLRSGGDRTADCPRGIGVEASFAR